MKIAILGKGGSGKSTVSWLLASYFSDTQKQNKILVIDADHNMDLMANLGIEVNSSTHVFYQANDEIRSILNMSLTGRWASYMELKPLVLTYHPNSNLLDKYIIPVSHNLDLITMGFGEEGIMYADKCAHGLSGHLKYILPTLEVKPKDMLLIDSVAGADMLNYGLYYGCDFIFAVVEGHKNSVKVATQLHEIATKQGINLKFILNKYNPNNQLTQEFEKTFKDQIVGKIPVDESVLDLDYTKISKQLIDSLDNLLTTIVSLPLIPDTQKHANLKLFEIEKKKLNS